MKRALLDVLVRKPSNAAMMRSMKELWLELQPPQRDNLENNILWTLYLYYTKSTAV